MEKLFKSMMAIAIAAFTFAACDDVPEPYNNPYNGIVITPEVQDADPEGKGTVAEPFNVAAALAKCKEVGEAGTTEDFYCKGYVTSITEISAQYGNATFKIADSKEGGTELTVYRAKGPGKADVKDENLVKLGDEVVICGKLVNFKSNTPEFTQGCYIVSINGKGDDTTPTEETIGTKDAPITVAKALEEINKLENGKSSSSEAYVKGKISKVERFNDQYKSITYYISDDGTETNQLQVYSGKGLNGADFTAITDLSVGQEVIILGKLKKYVKDDKVTPEMDQSSKIISLDGEGGTPTPTPTGDNLLTNGDFETWDGGLPTNWKTASSAGNATLTQSTDKHNGTYAVKIAGATSNKRMAYKETVYKAGTYTLKFFAKAATADGGSVTAGYVPVTEGQSINAADYKSGDKIDLTNTEWKEVTYQFTLDADTRLSVYVRMNKDSGKDILVDDVQLFGAGIVGGNDNGGNDGGTNPPATGDLGTAEAPITIAKALEVINTLSNGGTTDDEAFVKGKISKIKGYYSSKYITYYISDTGEESNELQIYNGVGINGADFTAKEDLSVGQTVVVKGKLMKYVKNDVVTPEINGGVLVSKE
jgi:hypothetical protein